MGHDQNELKTPEYIKWANFQLLSHSYFEMLIMQSKKQKHGALVTEGSGVYLSKCKVRGRVFPGQRPSQDQQ